MPKGVACTVYNCKFWEENNKCAASEIQIEIDAHANGFGAKSNNEEFSTELDEASQSSDAAHQDEARKSAETCCLTFVPKEG